jgi:bifunctional UDP-N-acetylglucosamine pyrophosphorylase/glucosamine-1-phosphate N-acetyltransferase
MPCESIVLAAGLGTRMRSTVPKVSHTLAGRPMLNWVAAACREATGRPPTIVIGPGQEAIRSSVEGAEWVVQEERLGTGHAALQAKEALAGHSGPVLIASGDMPLVTAQTMRAVIDAQQQNSGPITLLTVRPKDPRGFGRVVRGAEGEITGVIEQADATPEQLKLEELNAGLYCVQADWLWSHLEGLAISPKGEYYLTDLVAAAAGQGDAIAWVEIGDPNEVIGINTQTHLAEAEAVIRSRIATQWMDQGVRLQDPSTTYIDFGVHLTSGVTILANTHLQGDTSIGEGSLIGPNTVIRDSKVGERCVILASHLEGATLGDRVEVGPFGHLRQGAELSHDVHLGNFGEVKNSRLGPGVKMGHFSYIGDATIGPETNIGAGTITCNFDGKRKNATHVGSGAFIGSDTMLVAPVRIGDGSRTGAGSVVTKDVGDHSLAVGMPARVIRRLEDDDE